MATNLCTAKLKTYNNAVYAEKKAKALYDSSDSAFNKVRVEGDDKAGYRYVEDTIFNALQKELSDLIKYGSEVDGKGIVKKFQDRLAKQSVIADNLGRIESIFFESSVYPLANAFDTASYALQTAQNVVAAARAAAGTCLK